MVAAANVRENLVGEVPLSHVGGKEFQSVEAMSGEIDDLCETQVVSYVSNVKLVEIQTEENLVLGVTHTKAVCCGDDVVDQGKANGAAGEW